MGIELSVCETIFILFIFSSGGVLSQFPHSFEAGCCHHFVVSFIVALGVVLRAVFYFPSKNIFIFVGFVRHCLNYQLSLLLEL